MGTQEVQVILKGEHFVPQSVDIQLLLVAAVGPPHQPDSAGYSKLCSSLDPLGSSTVEVRVSGIRTKPCDPHTQDGFGLMPALQLSSAL